MPKTIDISVLNSIGHPKEMIENLLDTLVESIESSLGRKAKGAGKSFLGLFLENGYRVQLSKADIFQKFQKKSGLNQSQIEGILSSFLTSGIIRKTKMGRYELSNNYIATRTQEKIDAENRVLRTIKTTVQERKKHGQYLDKQYLDYITPSIPLIDFSKEELDFIEKSRRLLQRYNRRLRMIGLLALLALLALGIKIYINYKEAQNFNLKLQEEQEKTIAAKHEADDQRQQAVIAQEIAEMERDRAIQNEKRAKRQKEIADSLSRIAIADKDSILKLNLITQRINEEQIRLRKEAEENAKKYQKLADERKRQEKIAKEQEAKTNLLNKIITSRIAADRSLIISDEMERALVALEAYQINKDNPESGDVYHPSILRALTTVAPKIDKKLSYKKRLHTGAVRDIVAGTYEDIFYTTGSDGKILQWQIKKWNPIGTPDFQSIQTYESPQKAIINCIDLAPRGGQILAGGEWPYFQTYSAQSGKVLTHYPYEGKAMEELFQCNYDRQGQLIGLSKNYYYYWNGERLVQYDKIFGKAGVFIPEKSSISTYAFSGEYDDYSYNLLIQKLTPAKAEKPEEYIFYGKPKEVNYGAVTAAAVRDYDAKKRLIAVGFSKGKILLISTRNKSLDPFLGDNQIFNFHQAPITDIAFSDNGRFLAVASMDNSVSVWDLNRANEATYQPIVFKDMGSWCLSVAFVHNDKFILVGTLNGDLYFWNIEPEDYAEYTCNYLHDNPEEFLEEVNQVNIKQRKGPVQKNLIDEIPDKLLLKYFGIENQPIRIRVCD